MYFLSVEKFQRKLFKYFSETEYIYWVIQNDCGQVWQLCTKIYVATV
jgi:starvation-inducible outer membrane lipoprotein